jgi:hypothetical protein
VNSNSNPAWTATPRQMLKRLSPITWNQGGRLLRFLPPRVGNAASPCVLMLTARLGMIESKMRNRSEGATKNRSRIARVPTISTLSGG